jgi:hypothetical protein
MRKVSIDVDLDGIGHLLRDLSLAVPPFQRSYSWGNAQVETFWLDLRSAQVRPDPEYFLGTIVLAPGIDGRMTVIDGQQRLATATILLAAIRDAFADAQDAERARVVQNDYLSTRSLRTSESEPRLLLNEDDHPFFVECVVNGNLDAEQRRPSHVRIANAYAYLRSVVERDVAEATGKWDELLFRWTSFLETGAQIIVVKTQSEADSFLIFETLNDRGVALSVADLLKNYLFSLSRSDLPAVQQRWAEAVTALDLAPEETFTTFLRHYWSSLHGATRERDLYREIRRFIRSGAAALEFVEQLEAAAAEYAALLDAESEIWHEVGAGSAEAIAALDQLALEQNRPLLLAAMDHFDNDELRRLLRSLLSWSVRGVIAGGIGGGTAERYYADAAVRIRSGKAPSTEAVRAVLTPIMVSDEEFHSSFARASVPRAQVARYLLAALERRVANKRHPALLTASERRSLTVEPILPPSAAPDEWPAFGDDASSFARRLGNLALLRRDGPRLMRKTWPQRRRVLHESGFRVNAMPASAKEWTPLAIRKRQEEFAALALDIWPLNERN